MNPVLMLAGDGWKKLALGLGLAIVVTIAIGVAAWRGYKAGYAAADLKRQAEVADIIADHSKALAKAEKIVRERLETEVARSNELQTRFQAARRTIEKQSRELTNQRIVHASKDVDTADGTCRFGPEWVRLYNEATAGRNRGGTVPAATAPADGDAGATQAPHAGILPGAPTVTPEDILAHARDMGRYTRKLEAQVVSWIEWAAGLNAGEVTP